MKLYIFKNQIQYRTEIYTEHNLLLKQSIWIYSIQIDKINSNILKIKYTQNYNIWKNYTINKLNQKWW